VTWAPAVLEAAADFGLKLAKGGRLIDTSTGEYRLEDIELEEGIALEDAAELKTPPLDKLMQCVAAKGAALPNPASSLAVEGVAEAGLIVPVPTSDGFPAGPISGWWPHGFNLRQLTLQSGAYVPMHTRAEEEVIFVQSGTLEVSWPEGHLIMGAGDTFTTPIGLPRAFRNTASVPCEAVVVRGGEDPAALVFID
jgi:mannose-6-phosphate isomerase-like protein (cupin superfamily)